MSRPIKFRAWDKKSKQMCFVICLNCHRNQEHIVKPVKRPSDCYCQEVEYLILMQFTGLSDKNGKEIYEGDVCAAIFEWGAVGGEVVWDEDAACFGIKDGHELMAFLNHLAKSYEIKGNIHENPDLLLDK